MKNGKRILGLMLVLALFTGMAVGSGSSSDDEQKEITGGSGNDAKQNVTIEEQVLLDQDNVKITAKEYVNDDIWGDGIKLLIENNSEKNIGINCNAVIVNNYMITDLFYSSVAAGKKANETLYLSSSALEAAGIENVGQIELYFHVYDSDTYDTLIDADAVTVKTSCFSNMDVTAADVGIELYNQNGIRIVGKYVDKNSFWGTAVLLYLENNTGKNITVSCENMSINGFMVTPLFYSNIYAGKMSVDEITILSSDLEDNGITSIEDIEVTFHIYDSDTYSSIADTAPITIEVN